MDFSVLQNAKKKAQVIQEKQSENFEELYNEGIRLFLECENNEDISLLEKSADKFVKAIEYKSTQAGPYFYLAHIFFVLGKDQLAIDYLKSAESIDENFPKLKVFKKIVYESMAEEDLKAFKSEKSN